MARTRNVSQPVERSIQLTNVKPSDPYINVRLDVMELQMTTALGEIGKALAILESIQGGPKLQVGECLCVGGMRNTQECNGATNSDEKDECR